MVMLFFRSLKNMMQISKDKNKPEGLTDEEKEDSVNVKMHEEEIKECSKELNIIKSNLKNYTV